MRPFLIVLTAVGLVSTSVVALAEPVDAGGGAFAPGDTKSCHTDISYLNQMFGWQVRWPREWGGLADATDKDVTAAISRWRTAPAALLADQSALAKDSGTSSAAPQVIVDRVLPQVTALRKQLEAGPPPLGSSVSGNLQAQWAQLMTGDLLPAVQRFETFLKSGYAARQGSPGLASSPNGAACFAELTAAFTTMKASPAQIEEKGWALLRDTDRQIAELNRIPVSEVPQLLARLRKSQPGFTADDLVRKSDAAVARAKAAMPRLFDRPLLQDLKVEAIPSAMEASFPAGFYEQAPNGQPAHLALNLSRPGDRALMAEVIAFHEGLPGHHVPHGFGFPAGEFNSGFAEGWALYSEYLADEAGLYSGKSDRTGMMAKHLWAASRLVVEPGLHVHGWTRQQAVDFMRKHTALSDAEIALEVDRYIATPGQSLSYMLGYDRIAAARRYAEQALGRRFDIRKFHDVVLGKGYRPLGEMYQDVVAWADRNRGNPSSIAALRVSRGYGPALSIAPTRG